MSTSIPMVVSEQAKVASRKKAAAARTEPASRNAVIWDSVHFKRIGIRQTAVNMGISAPDVCRALEEHHHFRRTLTTGSRPA